MPKVSIIFPTYNGWEDTKECLKSISHLSYPKNLLEILVVDNNSKDGTPQKIKKLFPRVKLITSSKNLGYSKAVNTAVKKSRGDYILFSNNDIVLEENYLKSMTSLAESDLKIGIIGGMVYLKKPKGKIGFGGLRVNPYLGYHIYDLANLDRVRECDLPPAGGFFVRRSMLDKIGLLDEEYFIYFEDLDLSIRAKRNGYKVLFNPQAISYHGYGKTAFKQNLEFIIYQGYKSKWRCILKNANLLQIVSSLITQFTILILLQNLSSSIKTFKPMVRGVFWNFMHLKEILKARKQAYG